MPRIFPLGRKLRAFSAQNFRTSSFTTRILEGSSLRPKMKIQMHGGTLPRQSGALTGALLGLLTTLNGLDNELSADLQEDKEELSHPSRSG